MWSATDMGGSGLGREVTRGTTEATLWTSSHNGSCPRISVSLAKHH
jgi:hypothetical protein